MRRLRGEVSGARALESVRAIARHHRIQCTAGYDDAAAWLVGALGDAGLEPRVERVKADGRTRGRGALPPRGWACERGTATLRSGARAEPLGDFGTEPLAIIQRSAGAAGRFPLVAVGAGTDPADYEGREVRGRVVLASGPAHRVHDLAVVGRGAAGIVTDYRRPLPPVRGPEDDPEAVAYTSFWWSERAPRGWGFAVSPRAGARLRERLQGGERLELEVEIVAREYDTEIPLVSAAIECPEPGAADVLVLAHLCHPRPGANDNASGAAAALECARALAALRARGEWSPAARTVRFLWMPEWNGTLAWLAADPSRAPRTAAAINLDMVGEDQSQCGSTLLLEHPPHFLATFAETLLADVRREWIASGPAGAAGVRAAEAPFSGGSDHAVLIDPAFAVPCPLLIQWPDRYYHSSLDTPDRCDPDSLALAAGSAATYAGALAAAGPAAVAALADRVEQDARSRVDVAAGEGPRATAREGARGVSAIGSLARLGVADLEVARRAAGVAAHAAGRGAGAWLPGPASGPVPVRRMEAPLDLLIHLLPGWDDAPAADRERWRRLERELPGGRLSLDLAWYACDGRRSVGEIAAIVARESGTRVPAREVRGAPALETFFDAMARLGLCEWKEAIG